MAVIRRRRPSKKTGRDLIVDLIVGIAQEVCRSDEDVNVIFRRELRKAIEVAVKTFRSKERFLSSMEPVGPLLRDPVAGEFIRGVVGEFNELDRRNAEWLYERVDG